MSPATGSPREPRPPAAAAGVQDLRNEASSHWLAADLPRRVERFTRAMTQLVSTGATRSTRPPLSCEGQVR